MKTLGEQAGVYTNLEGPEFTHARIPLNPRPRGQQQHGQCRESDQACEDKGTARVLLLYKASDLLLLLLLGERRFYSITDCLAKGRSLEGGGDQVF